MTVDDQIRILGTQKARLEASVGFQGWLDATEPYVDDIFRIGSSQSLNFKTLKSDYRTMLLFNPNPNAQWTNEQSLRGRAKDLITGFIMYLQEKKKQEEKNQTTVQQPSVRTPQKPLYKLTEKEKQIDYLFHIRLMLANNEIDFQNKLGAAIQHISEKYGHINLYHRLVDVLQDFKDESITKTASGIQDAKNHYLRSALKCIDREISDVESDIEPRFTVFNNEEAYERPLAVYFLKKSFRTLIIDPTTPLNAWLESVISYTEELQDIDGITPTKFISLKNDLERTFHVFDSEMVSDTRENLVIESLTELKKINDTIDVLITKSGIAPEQRPSQGHLPIHGQILPSTSKTAKVGMPPKESAPIGLPNDDNSQKGKSNNGDKTKKKSFWYDPWVSGTGTKLVAEAILKLFTLLAGSGLISWVYKRVNESVTLPVWGLALVIFAIVVIILTAIHFLRKKT